MKPNKNYLSTTIAIYLSFLLLGINMSISAQYKTELAHAWGAGNNISVVLTVSSAVGIGSLIASLFTGIISDKFGRRTSAIIGSFGWGIFAFGTAYAPNAVFAYIIGIITGIAMSFSNSALTPAMMEAYPDSRSLVTLLTKFFVSFGQFILPFIIIFLSAEKVPFTYVFNFIGIAYLIIGIICFLVPFPDSRISNQEKPVTKGAVRNGNVKISLEAVALCLIGFTSTAVFMLWTQTNQELGKAYGLTNPALLQSVYAVCSLISVLLTSFIIKNKGIKESTILTIYPVISALALVLAYLINSPIVLFIVSGFIGFFAAGGLLQLAISLMAGLYPQAKATATSTLFIANGISNWGVIQVAAIITTSFGTAAPRLILIFNILLCIFGAILGLIVKQNEIKQAINEKLALK